MESLHPSLAALTTPAALYALLVVTVTILARVQRRWPEGFAPSPSRFALTPTGLWLAVTAVLSLGLLALLAPPDPTRTAVPWSLAAIEVWRTVLGPHTGWWVPALGLIALLALPTLDREPAEDAGRGREVLTVLTFWLGLFVIPTILAKTGGLAATSRPFSDLVWTRWLDRPSPEPLWVREIPGVLVLIAWYTLPAVILPRWRASRGLIGAFHRRLGPGRTVAVLGLALTLSLPIAALLSRELLGIGPWIDWAHPVDAEGASIALPSIAPEASRADAVTPVGSGA